MPEIASVFASLEAVVRIIEGLGSLSETLSRLPDDELVDAQRRLGEIRRSVQSLESAAAGEIAHRSRRELGHSGLAQKQGFRSPQAFLQHVTSSTSREATTLVEVGTTVREATVVDAVPTRPWLLAVGARVADDRVPAGERLSVEQARAIANGLGEPRGGDDGVHAQALAAAADILIGEASGLDADQLLRRARELRDDLDIAGVADRERRIHEQRGLLRRRLPSGVTQIVITPDLETDAFVRDLCDQLLAPRRGGVRFVDPGQREWADAVSTDPRTEPQYLHDSVADLLRQAATSGTAAARRIVGARQPAVRVHVTAEALQSGDGVAHIEGHDLPLSIASARRIVCANGALPIAFTSAGKVLDLGQDQRLFSAAQRIALSARDGGCRVPGCPGSAAHAEAHHIDHWARDRGKTNVDDGILLCRFHHLLVHNNGWVIRRRGGTFELIPPPDVDPRGRPIRMPSKNRAQHDLERELVAAGRRQA